MPGTGSYVALKLNAAERASGIPAEMRIFQAWTVRHARLVRLESYLSREEAIRVGPLYVSGVESFHPLTEPQLNKRGAPRFCRGVLRSGMREAARAHLARNPTGSEALPHLISGDGRAP